MMQHFGIADSLKGKFHPFAMEPMEKDGLRIRIRNENIRWKVKMLTVNIGGCSGWNWRKSDGELRGWRERGG